MISQVEARKQAEEIRNAKKAKEDVELKRKLEELDLATKEFVRVYNIEYPKALAEGKEQFRVEFMGPEVNSFFTQKYLEEKLVDKEQHAVLAFANKRMVRCDYHGEEHTDKDYSIVAILSILKPL